MSEVSPSLVRPGPSPDILGYPGDHTDCKVKCKGVVEGCGRPYGAGQAPGRDTTWYGCSTE
jgi:hypothetical protein